MKIFKFGGASVKDVAAIKNAAAILKAFSDQKILLIISAMGKTTNHLEELIHAHFNADKEKTEKTFNEIKEKHFEIFSELIPNTEKHLFEQFEQYFQHLNTTLENTQLDKNFDRVYDQIIVFGEMLSTFINATYFNYIGLKNSLIPAADYIVTNNTYREAKVNWEITERKIKNIDFENQNLIITQGFVAKGNEGFYTSLGREGSDFSAAIFAYCLNAEEVIIWKDVKGVLNADPKWFDKTEVIPHLSYYDTIELAYYGASVIHPKTIKPLQNKNIPLRVKSFLNINEPGTLVNNDRVELTVPSYIFKINQCLVSISPKDFSFIVEDNLKEIFEHLSALKIRINIMQNTALSFSFAFDYKEKSLESFVDLMKKQYKVKYNLGLELVTIRNYNQEIIEKISHEKSVLLELKSRNTIQMVMKNK
jgi:aspartate kinase